MTISEAREKYKFTVSDSIAGKKNTFVLLQNPDVPEAHILFQVNGKGERDVFRCRAEKGTILDLEQEGDKAYISCGGKRFFVIDIDGDSIQPLI